MYTEYCSVCRQPATAAWHGDQDIAVCSRCAVEVLPVLIADATDLHHTRPRDRAKWVAMEVERTYWRAMALRALGGRI